MKLAQLQHSFQEHVLHDDARIAGEILGDARFPTPMRLGIYSQAYTARLIEVLAETFPAVQVALGPDRFAQLCGEFARCHPSRFRSARAYGEELSGFLAARLAGPRARGIADLARFEWQVAAAFDAADHAALSAQSLADVAPARWPELRFAFSPTLRRVQVNSNCVAWWKFACAESQRPSRWRWNAAQQWLVWRRELAVFYRRLSAPEAVALDAGLTGATFGELCAQVSTPLIAATMLQRWFGDGLLVGASLEPARS